MKLKSQWQWKLKLKNEKDYMDPILFTPFLYFSSLDFTVSEQTVSTRAVMLSAPLFTLTHSAGIQTTVTALTSYTECNGSKDNRAATWSLSQAHITGRIIITQGIKYKSQTSGNFNVHTETHCSGIKM